MKGIGRGGINQMLQSRGRGGMGMMQQGRGGGMGGNMPYHQQSKIPYESYTCKRCGIKGHYIVDCPKNNDRNFDPSRFKGVPKNQQWRVSIVNKEMFMATMDKTMKSLIKQNNIF